MKKKYLMIFVVDNYVKSEKDVLFQVFLISLLNSVQVNSISD